MERFYIWVSLIYVLTVLFDLYYTYRINRRIRRLDPVFWTKITPVFSIILSLIPLYNIFLIYANSTLMSMTDKEFKEQINELKELGE